MCARDWFRELQKWELFFRVITLQFGSWCESREREREHQHRQPMSRFNYRCRNVITVDAQKSIIYTGCGLQHTHIFIVHVWMTCQVNYIIKSVRPRRLLASSCVSPGVIPMKKPSKKQTRREREALKAKSSTAPIHLMVTAGMRKIIQSEVIVICIKFTIVANQNNTESCKIFSNIEQWLEFYFSSSEIYSTWTFLAQSKTNICIPWCWIGRVGVDNGEGINLWARVSYCAHHTANLFL